MHKLGKILGISGVIGGVIVVGNKIVSLVKRYKENADKYYAFFLLENEWLKLKQMEVKIADYLLDCQYKKIAIYGMNSLGEALYRELINTDIEVVYTIDKNADGLNVHYCDVLKPSDELPPVDVVIVTPFIYFKEIHKSLSKKLSCPFISIQDIIYELIEE